MTATARVTVAELAAQVATLTDLVQTLAAAIVSPAPVASAPAKPSTKSTIAPEQRLAVQQAAHIEGKAAYHSAFATLARERGGVNASNRAAIEAESNAAGKAAAEAVYLAAGYQRCPAAECDRLVTPGYAVCPKHA